jgi:hypothetical protein
VYRCSPKRSRIAISARTERTGVNATEAPAAVGAMVPSSTTRMAAAPRAA